MILAELILLIIALYVSAGLVFGLAFVIWGVQRVDAGAHGAPKVFRLLILPGVAALWPLVLRWWLAARGARS